MEGIAGLEGKKIIIFYNDLGKISRKDGTVLKETADTYHLKTAENKEIILFKHTLVRIEVEE